jgi:hypothetical protein
VGYSGRGHSQREDSRNGARREAEEEVGPIPAYRVTTVGAQDCGRGWKFYVVSATVDRPFVAYCAQETDATGWFTMAEMANLRLHPEFRKWIDAHHSKEISRWVRTEVSREHSQACTGRGLSHRPPIHSGDC